MPNPTPDSLATFVDKGFAYDAAGVSLLDYDGILAEIQTAFRSIFGADAYLDADSQDGQWLGVLALAVRDLGLRARAVMNILNVGNAKGVQLERIAAMYGLARKQGVPATAKFSFPSSTYWIGRTSDAEYDFIVTEKYNPGTQWKARVKLEYSTIQDLILSGITKLFEATETKILNPVQYTTDRIVSLSIVPVTVGAVQLTMPEGAIPKYAAAPEFRQAQLTETDSELRLRVLASSRIRAQGHVASLRAQVLAVTGVTYCRVVENTVGISRTIDIGAGSSQPTLESHSILCLVDGNFSNADVANAIALGKSAGAYTSYGSASGDGITPSNSWEIKQSVTLPGGSSEFINFVKVLHVNPTVTVNLKRGSGWQDSIKDEITEKVVDLFSSLQPGQRHDLNRLVAAALLDNHNETRYTLSGVDVTEQSAPWYARLVVNAANVAYVVT